jgi:hypothetical protein
MRFVAMALLFSGFYGTTSAAQAKSSCKVCSDQQRACMKNYAGPTCKTEYQICMKSCKKS